MVSWKTCLLLGAEHFVLTATLVRPARRQHFSLSFENPKIKQSEPFVLFQQSQHCSFYNSIRYFLSYQFDKLCISINAPFLIKRAASMEKGKRAKSPAWYGDCNMTSPSLWAEDSCGPSMMTNGPWSLQVEQLSAINSSKFSFTFQILKWVLSSRLYSSVSVDPEQRVPDTFFFVTDDDRHYVSQKLQHQKHREQQQKDGT